MVVANPSTFDAGQIDGLTAAIESRIFVGVVTLLMFGKNFGSIFLSTYETFKLKAEYLSAL